MSRTDELQQYIYNISPKTICDDCACESLSFPRRQSVYISAKKLLLDSRILRSKQECFYCFKTKLCSQKPIATNSSIQVSTQANEIMESGSKFGLSDLRDIGFEKVGVWVMSGPDLSLQLLKNTTLSPALYAFVCNGEVMYVGKTSRSLSKRLYHYTRPGPTQSTNIRLNANLKEVLKNNVLTEIFAFGNKSERKCGVFEYDIPAALEDDIIRKLEPLWNKRK